MAKTSRTTLSARTRGAADKTSLLVKAGILIGKRLDAFLSYEPFLAYPDKVYELHEMRIAAKRLRYTLEIFQDAYTLHTSAGAEFGQALDAVKAVQEHLGALHDADVLVPRLLEHLGRILKDGYGTPSASHSAAEHAGADKKTKPAPVAPVTPVAPASLDLDGRPIAGVHRVNYDACQGLLNLCTQTRAERDARYDLLQQAWQTMMQTRQFDRLRALLAEQAAPQDTRTAEALPAAPDGDGDAPDGSDALPDGSDANPEAAGAKEGAAGRAPTSAFKEPDADHAANRQSSQVQRAPGEPGHVAAARRRSAAERGRKADAAGAEDRKPARDKPQTESEAAAFVLRGGQSDSGTSRDSGSRSRDDRNKRAGGKNVGSKNIGSKNVQSDARRGNASRAPRSARPRPDTNKGA